MLIIVSYDISDDRTRSQIQKMLEGYGDPVQRSVFEFYASDRRLEELRTRLKKEKLEDGDTIRIYRLCQHCAPLREIIGTGGKRAEEPGYYLV